MTCPRRPVGYPVGADAAADLDDGRALIAAAMANCAPDGGAGI
jgi:formylmethanofuran dehydrogenase subunit E